MKSSSSARGRVTKVLGILVVASLLPCPAAFGQSQTPPSTPPSSAPVIPQATVPPSPHSLEAWPRPCRELLSRRRGASSLCIRASSDRRLHARPHRDVHICQRAGLGSRRSVAATTSPPKYQATYPRPLDLSTELPAEPRPETKGEKVRWSVAQRQALQEK